MAFENYWEEKRQYDLDHKKEMIKIIPAANPMFNNSILFKNIKDVPNMSNVELREFINNNFDRILSSVYTGDTINEHVACFQDPRFLDAFADVLQRKRFFENDTIIKINNICYDYISFNNRDEAILNRLVSISNIINRMLIPRLLGLGISNNLASILLIARFSSFELNTCVKRVNFIIISQPKVLMTEEMITEIFKILYPGPEIWVKIFQYFMLDVIPEYTENDSWVSEDVEEVNSLINLSILDILNIQPSAIIRSTLVEYAESYSILNRNKPVRFSMQTLSDDYSRINDIVNYLRYQEQIIVP